MVCPHCGSEFDPPQQRTSRANRYYWGVVLAMIAAELGESAEELHDAFKLKFRSREDITTGLVLGAAFDRVDLCGGSDVDKDYSDVLHLKDGVTRAWACRGPLERVS